MNDNATMKLNIIFPRDDNNNTANGAGRLFYS